jgi:hypothetical protein
MEKHTWAVETVTHHKTGLLIARSVDLPGLYVHARNEEELRERIPIAIKAILEANGEPVGEIVRCEDEDKFQTPVAHYALNRCYA